MRAIVPNCRISATLTLLILFSISCYSQSISFKDGKYELGLGLGPSFFLGDLGEESVQPAQDEIEGGSNHLL